MNINIRKRNWSTFENFYPKFWIPIIPSKYVEEFYEFKFLERQFVLLREKFENLKIISSYDFLSGYNFSILSSKVSSKVKDSNNKKFFYRISFSCFEKYGFVFLWNDEKKPSSILKGGDVFDYEDIFILHQKLDICHLRVI